MLSRGEVRGLDWINVDTGLGRPTGESIADSTKSLHEHYSWTRLWSVMSATLVRLVAAAVSFGLTSRWILPTQARSSVIFRRVRVNLRGRHDAIFPAHSVVCFRRDWDRGFPRFAQVDLTGMWAPIFHEDQVERIPGSRRGRLRRSARSTTRCGCGRTAGMPRC